MSNKNTTVNLLLVALYIILTGVEVYSQEGRLYYRCPKAFFRAGNKCYYLSQDKSTWRDSHFKCQDISKNSTLAVPDKKMQDKNLRFKLNRKRNVSYETWIGGRYDWGRGVWVWGTTGKKIRYQAFSRSQRDTNYQWKCVVMDPKRRNRWGIRSCLEKKHYICEHPLEEVIVDTVPSNKTSSRPHHRKSSNRPYPHVTHTERPQFTRVKRYVCPERYFLAGTMCYHLSREQLKWRDASFKCEEMGYGTLAILDSELTDIKLKSSLKKRRRAVEESWIGGIFNWQRLVWIWSLTGCRVWYQDFIKNKTLLNEIHEGTDWNCMFMDPKMDYRWNSDSCLKKKHYICETPAQKLDDNGVRSEQLRYNSAKHRIDQSLCDANTTL